MKIEPFVMERMQSTWENQVEINLSESGVHPLTVGGARGRPRRTASCCSALPLGYPQTNGTIPLRRGHRGAVPGRVSLDHVQVTNGGSEANFVSTWSLLEPADEVVMLAPNYMQTWGLARAFAGRLHRVAACASATADGVRTSTACRRSSRRARSSCCCATQTTRRAHG